MVAGSAAKPVDEPPLTLRVQAADVVSHAAGVSGKRSAQVLRVRGNPLAARGPRYPMSLRFGKETKTIRLFAAAASRVSKGTVLVVEHVGHSVHAHQPTHRIADIITPADRRNEALMRIAVHNQQVPLMHIKLAETLLRKHDAPYMQDGYAGLEKWDVLAIFSLRDDANGLVSARYKVRFYSTTGKIAAEWAMFVDLDQGTVKAGPTYDVAPAAEPQ